MARAIAEWIIDLRAKSGLETLSTDPGAARTNQRPLAVRPSHSV
jgi:hypothetical protein